MYCNEIDIDNETRLMLRMSQPIWLIGVGISGGELSRWLDILNLKEWIGKILAKLTKWQDQVIMNCYRKCQAFMHVWKG